MSLFNTKKETNKQPINEIQKAKGRRAKTAQQTIPYEEVYPNGIIKVAPGLYSKSYYFGDMNFTTEKEDKQEEILKKYSKLLSKYAPNVTAQFTIFNRRTSAAKIKERFLLKPKSDDQQIFRDDYNKILADKIEEGRNDIQKERYMTLTLKTTDIIMANRTFATLDEETDNAVREINKTGVRPLTIEERICILHDIYKVGEEDFFPDLLKDYYDDENKFSLEVLRKRGLTTKDLIAPGNYMNGTMQIQLGDHNYAKTFLITNFPTAMDTSFLSEDATKENGYTIAKKIEILNDEKKNDREKLLALSKLCYDTNRTIYVKTQEGAFKFERNGNSVLISHANPMKRTLESKATYTFRAIGGVTFDVLGGIKNKEIDSRDAEEQIRMDKGFDPHTRELEKNVILESDIITDVEKDPNQTELQNEDKINEAILSGDQKTVVKEVLNSLDNSNEKGESISEIHMVEMDGVMVDVKHID